MLVEDVRKTGAKVRWPDLTRNWMLAILISIWSPFFKLRFVDDLALFGRKCTTDRAITGARRLDPFRRDYLFSELPENQRNFTGVSPELIFECVMD